MDVSLSLFIAPVIVFVASTLLILVQKSVGFIETLATTSRPLKDYGLRNVKVPTIVKTVSKNIVLKLKETGLTSSMEFTFHDTMMMACLLTLVIIAMSVMNKSGSENYEPTVTKKKKAESTNSGK